HEPEDPAERSQAPSNVRGSGGRGRAGSGLSPSLRGEPSDLRPPSLRASAHPSLDIREPALGALKDRGEGRDYTDSLHHLEGGPGILFRVVTGRPGGRAGGEPG